MGGALFSLRPARGPNDGFARGQVPSGSGFALPPRLIARSPALDEPAATRRTKIWEFSTNLHCSIVGTCLSTAELRQLLGKLGTVTPGTTDHDLHHTAVSLAARHDQPAKLLHKALDHRHKLAINRFAKAADAGAVGALWREAVKSGEIPGAYWATLTHPATTPDLVRQVFGEVHMLSHLVGAANRADIRRLAALEQENAYLTGKLQQQQQAFHKAVTSRDERIQALQRALAVRTETAPSLPPADPNPAEETEVLRHLIGAVQTRLDREVRRREAADARTAEARDALAATRAELAATMLRAEALSAETALLDPNHTGSPLPESRQADLPRLDGMSLLYVGGRPGQVATLRTLAERQGASAFMQHDGGVEDTLALLPGLAGRADLVLFPVDCVSHQAALAVKRLCRQTGKRFLPLRTASAGAFLAALRKTG